MRNMSICTERLPQTSSVQIIFTGVAPYKKIIYKISSKKALNGTKGSLIQDCDNTQANDCLLVIVVGIQVS